MLLGLDECLSSGGHTKNKTLICKVDASIAIDYRGTVHTNQGEVQSQKVG